MANKLKLRITNIFRSPLCSRRSKIFSDVTQHPFFYPQNNHHHHLFELFSPKKPPPSQPFPSICRPKTTQTQHTHLIPRTKLTGDTPVFSFPVTTQTNTKPKQRKKSRKKRNNSQLKNKKFDELLDSVSGNYSNYWFTSDEDENEAKDNDDRTTLFSSKSLSSTSDSSEFLKAINQDEVEEFEKGFKDSFAVVKRSSDPYNDFRTSMVEMIVERQLFGARDLEHLLQCFLALNSPSHHMVIVEVFTEIWEALFSDWQ